MSPAETGKVVRGSKAALTRDLDGSVTSIPVNADGTLGDRWTVDPGGQP